MMTKLKKYKLRVMLLSLIFMALSISIIFSKEPNLPTFNDSDLAQYDGVDLTKPVYIAYEGYVYDVSAGREEFYNQGKPYHYLAGKDSTSQLNIAGGGIIRAKYKVIAKYSR